jgi:hypothetical protein
MRRGRSPTASAAVGSDVAAVGGQRPDDGLGDDKP